MRPSEIATLLRPRRPAASGTARTLRRCGTVDDLRAAARRRLPRAVFDYVDGGAEDEVTMRRNRTAFDDLELVSRSLRDVSDIDLSTEILGVRSPLPLALAPTGFSRMMHPDGEIAAARAAASCGVPYALSTMATTSLEDVAAVTDGPLWFQLYVWRDRGLCRELIARAREAGYGALLVTVDVPVPGARERDQRNGLTIPPQLNLRTIADGARHPRWSWGLLSTDAVTFANVTGRGPDPTAVMSYVAQQFDPSVTWDDIAWMAQEWGGPVVLKGVMSADDARQASTAAPVDAVVVSNHGGRQLDHAATSIEVLPDVLDAVGDDVEVLVDSGFRRGSDIVKALALGARAVLVGRPYLYGLGAAGQAGVEHAVRLLAAELQRSLQLMGVTAVGDLDRDSVRRRTD